MMMPVRCFSCGTVVASAYEPYKEALDKGTSGQDALDATGLVRFCCRRMVVSHVPVIKDAAAYE